MTDVTPNYRLPLSWDKYPNDRDLIEEAFNRIDKALGEIDDSVPETTTDIIYDGEFADSDTVTLTDALDDLQHFVRNFEIVMNANGGSQSGEVVWSYKTSRNFKLVADLIGSNVAVFPLAPLDLTLRLEKNNTVIGNIIIDQNIPTFDFADDVSFVPGDVLAIHSNDAVTFRSVSVTLLAVRED